jgi:FKBP-type peptidyl-prolyl cis-trans isomerase
MKLVTRSLLATFAVLSLSACGKQSNDAKATNAAAGSAATLQSDEQKVSYGIGYNMGGSLTRDKSLTVDQTALMAGITDGLAKAKTRVPESEIEAAFNAVRQKIVAAQAAAGEKQLAEGKVYLDKNKTKPGVKTTASGLQYEVLKSGKGGPKPGPTSRVKVHYHGTLTDGHVFDSSVQRNEPLEIGLNEVIPAWTEGVQMMSVGDKWKFTVPSNLGYGPRGQGDIPPNAVLIFEVELLGFQ